MVYEKRTYEKEMNEGLDRKDVEIWQAFEMI